LTVLALGRLAHDVAELSSEIAKSKFESGDLVIPTPGCANGCARLPDRPHGQVDRSDTQQCDHQEAQRDAISPT